ncbi:MAG: hypothetical protein LUE29_09535 [Lachnospiraceae bacterium]|nr:hypothetical protein [Lachnospiraceae bacterium]
MGKKSNLINVLGMVATVIGMGATLLSNWANEQKMNERIKEEVDAALAEQNSDDDEEEEA